MANTSDTILQLLRGGCPEITFAKTPDGVMFVQAKQVVVTGKDARSNIIHQIEGKDAGPLLQALKARVAICEALNTAPTPDHN